MAAKKSRVTNTPNSKDGAAFTKPQPEPEFDPARPASFDLEGFISGARSHTNTRTIPVTSRPDVAAQVEELTAEADKLDRITGAGATDDGTAPRKRLSAVSEPAKRLREIRDQITDLEPQLDGTWLLVKLRGLEPSEQDTIRGQNLQIGVPLAAAIFAATAQVKPADDEDGQWSVLSADEWTNLIDAIGPTQYMSLDKAHSDVTYQAVTPDFYERYSASRATRSTSSN